MQLVEMMRMEVVKDLFNSLVKVFFKSFSFKKFLDLMAVPAFFFGC